jgi:hypothetical protein
MQIKGSIYAIFGTHHNPSRILRVYKVNDRGDSCEAIKLLLMLLKE